MKSASFLFVSVALHLAIVLAYPGPRVPYMRTEFVPVTVLSFAEGGNPTGNEHLAAITNSAPKPAKKSATRVRSPKQPEHLHAAIRAAKRRQVTAVPDTDALIVDPVAPTSDPAHPRFVATAINEKIEDADRGAIGVGEISAKTGGSEFGPIGRGTETGIGLGPSGNGTGSDYGNKGHDTGSGVLQLTQVSVSHAPPPPYPEAARQDSKEGRVLLRVLVDEEGKSKIVEIFFSSGSRILDQAAAEAVKRWSFSPARYGGTPTASWVKIPVDFRITEANK
jgi:TonB family protein